MKLYTFVLDKKESFFGWLFLWNLGSEEGGTQLITVPVQFEWEVA